MCKSVQSGGCRCGVVRYEVSGPPTWSAGCCCRDCARAHGTPFVAWVGFPPDRVKFLTTVPHVYVSSAGVLRGFCAECGTAISYGRDPAYDTAEPLLYVAAASLDDPEAFRPTEVVWYSQRPGWFHLSGDIPMHDTVSPEHANRAYNSAADRQ